MVQDGRPAPRRSRHSRTYPVIPAPILSIPAPNPVIPAPILSFPHPILSFLHPIPSFLHPIPSFPRRRESSTLRPARVYHDTTRAKENGTSNAVLFYKC